MKLLIIGIKWPPPTFIARKIETLLKQSLEVTVFSPYPISEKPTEVNFLRLITFKRKTEVFIALWWFLYLLATKLPYLFKYWKASIKSSSSPKEAFVLFIQAMPLITQSPDMIHFEWNTVAIKYLPFYDYFNCPIVISCRGAQVQIAPYNTQRQNITPVKLQQSFQRATAVHCVSNSIFYEAQIYGLTADKTRIIRPAVDPDFFVPSTLESTKRNNKIRIVSIGSVIWRKGYEYALQSIRYIVDNGINASYTIIGTGPKKEMQRILYTISDLELKDHVQLVGHLTPIEVREHLQESDIFLLSSLSEGISNAVLEAMSCKLPVVTTDCGGMREAITDGVEGFVVDICDPQQIAEKVMILANNLELRARMGKAGRERILQEFTLEQQAEKFLEMYINVLSNNRVS